MLDRSTRVLIERELEQLDRLRRDYKDLLQTQSGEGPDLVGRAALSTVLQSYYQGIEAIFQSIAKRIDESVPSSADWHRQLLSQMATSRDNRPAVISCDLGEKLRAFLGFRHLARHNYPFMLDWSMMRNLIDSLDPVSMLFRAEIEGFLDTMDRREDQED